MAKPVRMMILADCPHCRRALAMMDELKREHPEYAAVEVEIIEEDKQPALADSLDYYYVPTYFVDGKKLHEGVPTAEAVERVYREALSE